MKYLTSRNISDILEPTGVRPAQFQGWCNDGFITPAGGGGSQGRSRLFSVMQVVGIAVATKVFASEQGCLAPYVGKVVDAFAAVTEEWLSEQFSRGRTHFITLHHGRPMLREKAAYELVNVQETYREVLAYVARIESNAV